MSEVSSSSSITTSGRIVRAALIIFPFGRFLWLLVVETGAGG
jgi:hypothetical protein